MLCLYFLLVCVCVVAPEKIDNVGVVRVCVFRFFIFSFVFVPCCDFCFYFGFVVFPFFFCFSLATREQTMQHLLVDFPTVH